MDTEPQIAPSSPPPPPGPADPHVGGPAPIPASVTTPALSDVELQTTPALLPKTPEVPRTNTSVGRTSPIADAIRREIRTLVDVEVLELGVLEAVVKVARSGRELVAVRNPTIRFDAKAQGLGTQNDPCALSYNQTDFICSPEDMGDYEHWQGPMVRSARDRRHKEITDALRNSPLAIAVKTELLELVDEDPFGPSQLLEVEQLATHAHNVLCAALGLSSEATVSRRGQQNIMNGGIIGGYGINPGGIGQMSPYSSPETFGAKFGRELIAAAAKKDESDPEKLVLAIALARQKGLDDLAGKLETQLGIEPSPPSTPHAKEEEA